MLWCSEMVLNRKVLIYILCVHSEIKNKVNSGFVRGKLEIPSATFKNRTDESRIRIHTRLKNTSSEGSSENMQFLAAFGNCFYSV